MANVFLARTGAEAGLRRFVALKCLKPELASEPRFVDMFLDEARVTSRVSHPNLCAAIDFGARDGAYYIAFDYVRGKTLKDLRQRLCAASGALTTRRRAALVARIIADAAEALHAAHELRDERGKLMGIVHRDVSPENVMVAYDGGVKVIDFGVAWSSVRRVRTATGIVKGKYAYLQPEALGGQPVDRRADVWSLGIVLWELLTGQRLFQRSSDLETVRAIGAEEVPRPSDVCAALPVELDAIVKRALARDPDHRYPTARDFGAALTRFVAASGEAIGLADVAELMHELFADDAAADAQLLADAEQVDDDLTFLRADVLHVVEPDEPARERTARVGPPPTPPAARPRNARSSDARPWVISTLVASTCAALAIGYLLGSARAAPPNGYVVLPAAAAASLAPVETAEAVPARALPAHWQLGQ